MSEALTLSAETRERAGKGASRYLRREGRVPAVIYGDKKDALGIHVAERQLARILGTGHFMNSVIMVEVGGETIRTLPKDVQFHPVSDRPLHVDFLRIGEHSKVHVNVPVHFEDEEGSPGIKRGGVLNIVRHEIELIVDAAQIPSEISVRLTGLDVGDSVHLADLALPQGATAVSHGDNETIATIVAPSALRSADDQADEDAAAAASAASSAAAAEENK